MKPTIYTVKKWEHRWKTLDKGVFTDRRQAMKFMRRQHRITGYNVTFRIEESELDTGTALLLLRNSGHIARMDCVQRFWVDEKVYTRDEFLALVDPSRIPSVLF